MKDGDELIGIKETTGNSNIIIVTKFGKCICFNENDVRPMGRLAGGVRAITLEKGDEVVAMDLAKNDEELLVVTQGGFGKRTAIKEYKVQARGGKGLLTYDKSKFDKTGALIGAIVVNEQDEIFSSIPRASLSGFAPMKFPSSAGLHKASRSCEGRGQQHHCFGKSGPGR